MSRLTNEQIREFINRHEWRFAKTYAAFCPHEYTLREWWNDRRQYNALVHHIWQNGVEAIYGTTEPKRYWFDFMEGRYYFIYPEDTDQFGNATGKAYLINRALIADFIFFEDMIGMRCRTKRKNEPFQNVDSLMHMVWKYQEKRGQQE